MEKYTVYVLEYSKSQNSFHIQTEKSRDENDNFINSDYREKGKGSYEEMAGLMRKIGRRND